jgi:hypothetical protein
MVMLGRSEFGSATLVPKTQRAENDALHSLLACNDFVHHSRATFARRGRPQQQTESDILKHRSCR